MPVYKGSDQLYACMKGLFGSVGKADVSAADTLNESRLIIQLNLTDPDAEILINARRKPIEIKYGKSNLRPDLEITLSADTMHKILIDELSIKQAFTSGQVKVRGPIWKSFVLEGIFRSGQESYLQVLRDQGVDGYHLE